jgi:hypothetical protein
VAVVAASSVSGFARNVGRLRRFALHGSPGYSKIPGACFPVERSRVFFIRVQEKEGCT